MSASQFNLLPARYAEQVAERRWARMIAVALVAVLGALVLLGLNQGRRLGQAERKRDAEQARSAVLTARTRELVRFRQLADAIAGRERLLAAAMGTEVSWASVLANLGRIFPADSSLTSVILESKLAAFGALPLVKPGDQRSVIGTMALKGYSVEKFTPGVERLLKLLATVNGLTEPRLQVGNAQDLGTRRVTTFEGSTFIDGRALSGRYAQGLPAEDDVEVPAISGGAPAQPGAQSESGPSSAAKAPPR